MKETSLLIPYDLDEAIRMGSCAGIIKDGPIRQTAPPEEIITRSADDYVADPVAAISKLKFVVAQTVMPPMEVHKKNVPPCPQWRIVLRWILSATCST